jgi:hypothetical protein
MTRPPFLALALTDWARLQDPSIAASFWALGPEERRLRLDGSDWPIEGRRKDIYRAVSRWSPQGQFMISEGRSRCWPARRWRRRSSPELLPKAGAGPSGARCRSRSGAPSLRVVVRCTRPMDASRWGSRLKAEPTGRPERSAIPDGTLPLRFSATGCHMVAKPGGERLIDRGYTT